MFDQILDLVGQPPGSLVYHFIILFAVEAAFAIAIGQWMRERDSGTLRLVAAIFLIFLGRVLILVASLAAWQGYLPYNTLIPPVERLVDTMSILSLSWVFVTMDDPEILRRNFIPDVVHAGLLGISFVGFAGTYYFWSAGTAGETLFNGLWIDTVWAGAQMALCIYALGWLIVRVRYVYDPFLKGVMLILPAAAAAFQMIQPVPGDAATAMRLAQLVVMPMVAAVAYRHVVEQLLHWDTFEPSRLYDPIPLPKSTPASGTPAPSLPLAPPPDSLEETVARPVEIEVEEPEAEEAAAEAESEPESRPELEVETDQAPAPASGPDMLEVVDAIGGLLSTLEPTEIAQEAPRTVARALRADIAVLAIVDENIVNAGLVGGYDNIAQGPLPQGMLDLANHPTIVNALGRLRQMRLTPQRNGKELRDLYSKLLITHEGPAYLQPLVNGDERIGVLIAASPYSGRQFSNEERNLLDRMAPLVTAALLNSEDYKDAASGRTIVPDDSGSSSMALSDELTARTAELDAAQRQIEEMKAYIRDMHRRLEELPQQHGAVEQQVEKLTVERNELRAELEALRRAARRADDLEEELIALRRYAQEQQETTAEPVMSEDEFTQKLEEVQHQAHTEISTLRLKLTQATASQQEVSFLQEQIADRAREVVKLQSRLLEAQAVADALREQVTSGLSNTRELETLQGRVATQATQIAQLKTQLLEAEAVARLSPDAVRAQEEMEQIDRDAMAQLEAQLAERGALVEALEKQLSDKARAVTELKSHMSEVNESLNSLEDQLTHKTEEIDTLQNSLAKTREAAGRRIASLEAALKEGRGDASEMDHAHAEALEAELAEKAAAINSLEDQLDNTRQSMLELEHQLTSTNRAVDAAISDAQQLDSQDQVIASIAQELRTPMSSIMGYTELLLRESVGILGPLQKKFLQRVKANTERMSSLLDDLIRLSALDGGHLQLLPERVDVVFTIEEAVGVVTPRFEDKSLTLRMAVPRDLPPITADRRALQDIFESLLSNAALASRIDGEVELRVEAGEGTLTTEDDREITTPCLHIAVEDSGQGIDPDDYDRVFAGGKSDNGLVEGLGNTGTGMSRVKSLIEAHGGNIWLESSENGTTFFARLPLDPTVLGIAS